MADTPRYGYNAQGQWTILQPGEEEWNPDVKTVLAKLYGNDTTSLIGNFYNAGGDIAGGKTGGLLATSGASPKTATAKDVVYEYTRPWTDAEQTANRDATTDWYRMEMNSSLWNKNDQNAYAIQNSPVATSRGNVSDQSKWTNWASENKYIEPVKETVRNNSSTPVRTSGGLVNLPGEQRPNVLAPNSGGGLLNTQSLNTGSSPYLSRVGSSSQMAYSGAPRYNDITPSAGQQSNGGLTEASKAPSLQTPATRSTDFSRALWR